MHWPGNQFGDDSISFSFIFRDSDSINSSTISDKIGTTQSVKTMPNDPTAATTAPASPVTPVSGSGASGTGNVSLKVPSIFR